MTIYHLAIGFVGKPLEVTAVQAAFPPGAGWARYAPNCWLVSTEEGPDQLADRIRKIVTDRDSIFAVEVKLPQNGGYLQKELWDWIREKNRSAPYF